VPQFPDGLDLVQAAALPMTVDTAFWHLTALGFDSENHLRFRRCCAS
jgi:NADPH:quinone reductase-like Zn-dependent oxidoreductase